MAKAKSTRKVRSTGPYEATWECMINRQRLRRLFDHGRDAIAFADRKVDGAIVRSVTVFYLDPTSTSVSGAIVHRAT